MWTSSQLNQQRRAAVQIAWRCALFVIPFAAMTIIELFLPVQAFSFRLWEPLTEQGSPVPWSGPFIPNRKASMREEGDLAHGSKWAVAKDVYWETDARGFRNRQSLQARDIEIVVVGDSMIAGTSLTQDDRLTDRLTNDLHRVSYAYAPGQLPALLGDLGAQELRPKTIILESVERSLTNLRAPLPRAVPRSAWRSSDWLFLNRLAHPRFFRYFQAEWTRFRLGHPPQGFLFPNSPMVFFMGEGADLDADPQQVASIVATLKEYQHRVESLGMRFIFLPIPNKETVYYDLLPSKVRRHYLEAVIEAAKHQDIATVDTATAFDEARRERPDRLLYHLDDSHWNAAGVQVVLDALKPSLQ